jgi:hypothetical protein
MTEAVSTALQLCSGALRRGRDTALGVMTSHRMGRRGEPPTLCCAAAALGITLTTPEAEDPGVVAASVSAVGARLELAALSERWSTVVVAMPAKS